MSAKKRTLNRELAAAILCLALSVWVGITAAGSRADIPPRPNIIHFMSDDHGWGHTGYDGHPVIKTPNLDAMAKNGLRLDRFYVACPKCSPTRYSVLTGLNPYRYGFFNGAGGGPFAKSKEPDRTIAEIAAAAGYLTAHLGKWHLGPLDLEAPTNPTRRGFEYWRTSFSRMEEEDPVLVKEDGTTIQVKGNSSEVIVSEAISLIRKAKNEKRPFLIVLWTSDPHGPWKPPADIQKSYKGKEGILRYFGEITEMDRALGQLRQALRDLNVAENTMLWFNSDNGGSGADRTPALRGGKTDCWEGGIRVPAVIEWPTRIKPGSHSDVPVGTVDLLPTIGGLVGAVDLKTRVPVDGIDLQPLFDDQMTDRSKPLPFSWTKSVGLVDNRYKICLGDPDNKKLTDQWRLFDLREDPEEAHNLAAQRPELLAEMQQQLEQWMESTKATARKKK